MFIKFKLIIHLLSQREFFCKKINASLRDYSSLKLSAGSTFAAKYAGYAPKKHPKIKVAITTVIK